MRLPSPFAVLTGLVGLGVVGAVRRLLEVRARRKGRLAPAGAATITLARGRIGRVGEAVEHWSPAPPSTRLGRELAAAWAAPLTVVGALLVFSGGGRATWDRERACWVATEIRGPSGRILKAMNFDANTLGQMVIVIGHRPSPRLLDHEAAHARQGERLGPAIIPLYAWFGARHGYRDNPLERAARRTAHTRARSTSS